MLYARMLRIRDEEDVVITPYFPADELPQESLYESIEKAFIFYKELREKQTLLISQLEALDFEKEATHKEYIKYNIPLIINHIIFHEYWHMYRIEELWLTRDEYFKGDD